MSNCGLKSLEQMATLKSVSMYSLIHLAKDNGINLYFCKAEPEQFMQVVRPAIFHQKNHFVFVANGEKMPPGEYDGYVLTPKPINEPLSHSLARRVRGSKKGGDILGPIIQGAGIVIGNIIAPGVGGALAGGALGLAMGVHRATGGAGFSGNQKGEWWRIPLGAATGYTMGGGNIPGLESFSPAMQSGFLAAAGEIPGAIKSGNFMAPLTAGIGQYMGASALAGGQAGFKGATGNIGDKLWGAGQGAIKAITGGGGTPGGGIEIAGNTPSGYADSMRLTGAIPGRAPSGSLMNLPGIGQAGIISNPAAAAAGASTGGAFSLGKLLPGGGTSNLSWLGTAASALIPPPKLEGNIQDNYAKSAQYLGGDNYNALPSATRKQLEQYVNTPLDQLATQFTQGNDKALNNIDLQKQKAIDAIMVDYANRGQDPYSSTQAQQALTEINRQYDQAKAEVQQQIQNQAMNQAIEFKQQILEKSMEQGQFDYNAAMELATYIGRDQELKYAMDTKNHEQLQKVLAEIFSMGIGKSQSQTLGFNTGMYR